MASVESSPVMAAGRYELLVKSVTDYAIYMLDPTGIVSSWNAGAARFKGYAADEIIGQHFSRFYTDEDRATDLPRRALATALGEGRFVAEGWRVRKDGERFWASVVIEPVRDETGRHIGFAKVTRDLTERREAQRALEAAQQRFLQAQKMEAIGKLTGGVAHDFNNLLAAVIGSLDLARRRLTQGHDVSRFIDNAMKAAERGATLTQRMLAFARKQELKTETLDVPLLFGGMAEMLQRTLGPTIALETRFPPALHPVCADAAQLELALMNLAVNARDAMPGGGSIIFSAREERLAGDDELADGAYVCLTVRDAGEGMDADTLARASEPFFTTKGVGKGTGLGLPMVHGFAEQSGGRLRLQSTPGEGTVAEIWLPAAFAPPVTIPGARDITDPIAAADSLAILAVDDDQLVLTNTAAMLEDLGHRVFQASSARQALAILGEESIDLVLTDYAMPETTGAELAKAIRARRPNLPILLVSGFAEIPADAARGLPKLAKPFREDELARAIAAATGNPCRTEPREKAIA